MRTKSGQENFSIENHRGRRKLYTHGSNIEIQNSTNIYSGMEKHQLKFYGYIKRMDATGAIN